MLRNFKLSSIGSPSFSVIVISIIAFVLLPFITSNQFYRGVVILVCIYAVIAMAWDIFSGFTGYLNFGIAFSFGVGGYTAAFLSTHYLLEPVLSFLFSGLSAVLFGLLIGTPSLRLKGHFFILVSLLVPLASSSFLNYLITEDGSIFGVNQLINNSSYIYASSVILFSVTAVSLYVIANSKFGLLLRAIRENEVAAEASGLRTGRYKILAFSVSSFFSGMAGALYVYSNGVASPTNFGLTFSALPVMMAALGGMGTIVGPILGAFIIEGLIDLLRIQLIQDARLLIASILLLVVLVYLPRGIWGIVLGGERKIAK
jgi:branched-chain amino acid transport system permease protein